MNLSHRKPIMQMINFRFALIIAIASALFSFSCSSPHTNRSKGWVQLKLEPLQTNTGWGYEVFAGKKLYIKQDKIPVLEGNQGFKTREQALHAGQIVINKLKKGQAPALDSNDLKKVGVQF